MSSPIVDKCQPQLKHTDSFVIANSGQISTATEAYWELLSSPIVNKCQPHLKHIGSSCRRQYWTNVNRICAQLGVFVIANSGQMSTASEANWEEEKEKERRRKRGEHAQGRKYNNPNVKCGEQLVAHRRQTFEKLC